MSSTSSSLTNSNSLPPIISPRFSIESRYSSLTQNYLAKVLRVPEYVRLLSVKNKGWEDDHMGKMFQERRLATHTYDLRSKFDPVKSPFFVKGKLVMEELDQKLDLIPPCQSFKFVDLCCCPGGFSQYILEKNWRARGRGFSLHPDSGGHRLCITGSALNRWAITYQDVTHYDFYTPFLSESPTSPIVTENSHKLHLYPLPQLPPQDLVIADGQFLRELALREQQSVPEEASLDERPYERLIYSQLLLALVFLRPGGTLVFKFTHCDRYATIHIIRQLQSISDSLTCFKPMSCWSHSASFYVVAKGMQTDSPRCGSLIREWTAYLCHLMLGPPRSEESQKEADRLGEDIISSGELEEMVPMFRQVWETQARSLEQMLRSRRVKFGKDSF